MLCAAIGPELAAAAAAGAELGSLYTKLAPPPPAGAEN